MSDFLFWSALGFTGAVVVASFFEWTLHRFVMHRPLWGFRYPYRTHTLVHHRVFRADASYHLQNEKDRETIPMAWWNGPVLVAMAELPVLGIAAATGAWGLAAGSLVAFAGYYGAYEYLHWCMHLPRRRAVERSGLFFRLNGHHILHHRYMRRNFNVVLPLADLCLGTLMVRSRIAFPQPTGPAVPDLQPRAERERAPRRLWRFLALCLTGVKSR